MDDDDLGVVISVTSLVMTMAQDHLDAFSVCYQKAVDRLHKACFHCLPLRKTNTSPADHRPGICCNVRLLPDTIPVAPGETVAAAAVLPSCQ
jgi:hypothetical protein